jgi:hypothetical protein
MLGAEKIGRQKDRAAFGKTIGMICDVATQTAKETGCGGLWTRFSTIEARVVCATSFLCYKNRDNQKINKCEDTTM